MTKQPRKKRVPAASRAVLYVCILALVLGILYLSARRPLQEGEKQITVAVLHSDGSTRNFTYVTEAAYLGQVLAEEGLISGTEDLYGLFVDTVDGETADFDADGGWWCLWVNGEEAPQSVDATPIADGDAFIWAYTVD